MLNPVILGGHLVKQFWLALTIVCFSVLTGCNTGAGSLSSPSRPATSTISPPQLKFSMVIASLSGAFAIPWIADATGAFSRHGVSVSMPYMEQTNAAFAAMVAGDVDAMEVSAGPVITANVNGDLDLVYVAAIMNHPQFALVVGPSVRTVEDLKGKTLATDQPYQGPDYGMQVALSKLGLTPTDAQLRRVGGPALAWGALKSNQVDGAILAPPFTFTAEKAGYHAIVDIYDQPYQNVGIVMPRSRIDALKPALLAILPA